MRASEDTAGCSGRFRALPYVSARRGTSVAFHRVQQLYNGASRVTTIGASAPAPSAAVEAAPLYSSCVGAAGAALPGSGSGRGSTGSGTGNGKINRNRIEVLLKTSKAQLASWLAG